MILSRPNTNWNFLFLNIKMVIRLNKAEPKNNPKYNKLSFAKKGVPSFVVHNWNTKIKPADANAATIK